MNLDLSFKINFKNIPIYILWGFITISPLLYALLFINARLWSIIYNGIVLISVTLFIIKYQSYLRAILTNVDSLLWFYTIIVFLSTIRPNSYSQYEGILYAIILITYTLFVSLSLTRRSVGYSLRQLESIIKILFLGYITVLIGSILLFGFQNLSVRGEGPGTLSPSNIGKFSAIASIIGFHYVLFQRNIKNSILFLLAFIVLVFSFSKGSYFSFLLAVSASIIFYIKPTIKNIRNILLSISLILLIYFVLEDFISSRFAEYMQNPENLYTLTGRTTLWALIYERLIVDHVWFGYGYHSTSLLLGRGFAWGGDTLITQSHNAYLESMLNVGLFGTLILMFLIIKKVKTIIRLMNFCTKMNVKMHIHILFSLLIFLIVRGLTEGSFAQAGSSDVFLLIFILVGIKIVERNIIMKGSDQLPQKLMLVR